MNTYIKVEITEATKCEPVLVREVEVEVVLCCCVTLLCLLFLLVMVLLGPGSSECFARGQPLGCISQNYERSEDGRN